MSLFPHFGFGFEDFGYSLGPAIHSRESDEGLVLELEVPRYRQEELDVHVDSHTLIIAGKRANELSRHDRFLFGDTPSSSFRRAVHIPHAFDATKMKWELSHGVLVITIPHAPQAKAPEPQRLPIGGAPAQQQQPQQQQGGALTTRDKHGMEITTTSKPEEFQAVARMNWPPKIKRDEADGRITYTCSMPPTVTNDHLDLSLQGRNLTLGVHHHLQQVKKDSAGNTVFNQQQSVSYSTNLLVPEGTTAADISTDYNNGNLTITVSKHDNPTQSVPVTKAK